MEETRFALRTILGSLAYRLARCLDAPPAGFADFTPGHGVRTPAELLRHLTGLMHFAHGLLLGLPRQAEPPLDWEGEVGRLQAAMVELDAAIASATEWPGDLKAALQGPICDALTHVGQLATLRRLAGSPIHGGNYPRADIRPGDLRLP